MMINFPVYYVVYNPDGGIELFGTSDYNFVRSKIDAGEPWLMGKGDFRTHYVKDGEITLKTPGTAVLSGMTITGLPTPCTIEVDGVTFEVTDGVAELELPTPGTYDVTVKAPSTFPQTLQVVVP